MRKLKIGNGVDGGVGEEVVGAVVNRYVGRWKAKATRLGQTESQDFKVGRRVLVHVPLVASQVCRV